MKKYDLIVAGGGISGVAAAVSAAREGMSVLLVERDGCLGGAMANMLVFPFMKYSMPAEEGVRLLSDGIFTEMRRRKEQYNDPSWECYKFVFDDMVTEAGVDVLFHAAVFDVRAEGRRIKSVSAVTKSGVMELEADFFIDCTGDGDVMALSGCDFQMGRESDSLCQPMTTCFRIGGVDKELYKEEKTALQEKYRQWQAEGKITNPREDILAFWGQGDGILHLNTTRVVKHDPVDAFQLSRAEMLARGQVWEMVRFLKENSEACKNLHIVSIASHIGIRESRKLKGVHILTTEELKNCVSFPDTIALGNYMIDIHNPSGSGTYRHTFQPGEYYQIPYRSLMPKEFDNLLVAGRCVSAEHEAHSAVRILPISACMGQAAGTALAIARKTGTNAHTVDIQEVRARLRENGAAI